MSIGHPKKKGMRTIYRSQVITHKKKRTSYKMMTKKYILKNSALGYYSKSWKFFG